MSNYTKLMNNLEELKLERIKENLDTYVDLVNSKEKDMVDALYELTRLELQLKEKNNIWMCENSRISISKNI